MFFLTFICDYKAHFSYQGPKRKFFDPGRILFPKNFVMFSVVEFCYFKTANELTLVLTFQSIVLHNHRLDFLLRGINLIFPLLLDYLVLKRLVFFRCLGVVIFWECQKSLLLNILSVESDNSPILQA